MASRSAAPLLHSFLPCFIGAACLVIVGAGASLIPGAVRAKAAVSARMGAETRYVIHISVDGLRPDAITKLGPSRLPHFYRLRIEGAYTDNARTDYDFTNTLPNHACELTSRPALGPAGHGVDFNSDDGRTLAAVHGSYVAGVFDVVHDNGLATAMYASKRKFDLFERSWNAENGAPDTVGEDNGRDKIDIYVNNSNTAVLVTAFVADMESAPRRYSFIHLNDLDAAGHDYGWNSEPYFDSLVKLDGLLGRIFDLVDGDARLAGETWILLTADHGGTGKEHSDVADPFDYTVPLYVWGPGVPCGADVYWLNAGSRANPGSTRPMYGAAPQPVRNGEAANVSLCILGLGAVPGSTLDAAQDCAVFPRGGEGRLPAVTITVPPRGAHFAHNSRVVIEASAQARTGSIVRVDFFANSIKLGQDSTSPYTFEWNGAPLGRCHITARAVRSDSLAGMSSVDIEMTSAAPGGHSSLWRRPGTHPDPFERGEAHRSGAATLPGDCRMVSSTR